MGSIILLTVSVILISLPICELYKSYTGYKVFQVRPKTRRQFTTLQQFRNQNGYDIWKLTPDSTDIMVEPSKLQEFKSFLSNDNYNATIVIDNVGKLIQRKSRRAYSNGSISFAQYERYDTICNYIKILQEKYPKYVQMINLGKTWEGRDLIGIQIALRPTHNKPFIFIDSGIHAREWIAPATALFIIHKLVEEPNIRRKFLSKINWFIIPVLNPDGYEYSHTTDRFWRKNRHLGPVCNGVDLNRNFGFKWESTECDDGYPGSAPFSEPETKHMRQTVNNIRIGHEIKAYITLHSYGKFILYPWAYTKSKPKNVKQLQFVAQLMNTGIKNIRGSNFKIGSVPEVLYTATGCSMDWMMAVANISLSYAIELHENSFETPKSEIPFVNLEIFSAVKGSVRFIMK